jgi:hypothetical protein
MKGLILRGSRVAPLCRLNRSITSSRFSLLAAVVVLGLSLQAFSSTVAVGTCTNLPFYPTISLAVSSVPAGSTIKVCPNNYAEQVLITKSLTLEGVSSNGAFGTAATGANNPVIVSPTNGVVANASDLFDGSPIAAQIAVITPAGSVATPIVVNIDNIAVDGSNNQISGCGTDLVGIYYQNASGTIDHVATRFQELSTGLFGCQSGLAIFAQSGYSSGGTSTITIENSSVHDYDKNGITVDGSGMNATVTMNYVVGIGATPLIAQNGIQVSDGATGTVTKNTVTDDVYVNPSNCGTPNNPACYSATGILLYDSGGTSAKPLLVTSNIVSNAQGGIVAVGDSSGTADYNTVSSNRITTSPAAGPYQLDGIDLCSNHNTASLNTVFNASGSGVHIDSSCTESTGSSGNNTSATTNTVNEACAGVLTGNGTGNSESGNITYNVVQVSASGDSCPAGSPVKARSRLKPRPWRP